MPNNPPYPNVLGAKWLRHAQIWRANRNCHVKTFFTIKTLPTYSPYFCNMQYCRKQGFPSLRLYVYTVGEYTRLPSCSHGAAPMARRPNALRNDLSLCLGTRSEVRILLNASNAKANFVQSTRTQIFLKAIHPCHGDIHIFQLSCIILYWQN